MTIYHFWDQTAILDRREVPRDQRNKLSFPRRKERNGPRVHSRPQGEVDTGEPYRRVAEDLVDGVERLAIHRSDRGDRAISSMHGRGYLGRKRGEGERRLTP